MYGLDVYCKKDINITKISITSGYKKDTPLLT